MPIGLSTAILGSAVIAGGAGLAASAIGSKNQANAAREAAAVQTAAADKAAQTQLAMFGQVRSDLTPYRNFGASALPGAAALLGLPTGAPSPAAGGAVPVGATYAGVDPTAVSGIPGAFTGQPAGPDWGAYLAADPGIAQQYGTLSAGKKAQMGVTDLPSFAAWHWQNVGRGEEGRLNPYDYIRVGQTEPDPQYALTNGAPQAAPAGAQTAAAPAMDPAAMQSFLENTPGYQFTKTQGMKALTSNLSSRGLSGVDTSTGLPMGALGKGLARYVTGLADQTYGNQVDRYMKAIGIGQAAAGTTAQSSGTAASGIASSITGGAQAAASGITGAANAGAAGLVGAANAIGGIANAVPNAMITDKVLGMYAPR